MDKGWNYGFIKFYEKIELIGYQGFIPFPEYMCLSPTKFEEDNHVIPKKIVLIGNSYKNIYKEFFPNLKIIIGPALRFADLFQKKPMIKKKYDVVLFLEGVNENRDLQIIKNLIRINKNFTNTNFFIKSHPISLINLCSINLPNNFQSINSSLSDIACNTNIAICYGSSSSILETLSYGCKLIIPYDNL